MYAEYLSWSVSACVDAMYDSPTDVVSCGSVGCAGTTLVAGATIEPSDDSATSPEPSPAYMSVTGYTSVYSYAGCGAGCSSGAVYSDVVLHLLYSLHAKPVEFYGESYSRFVRRSSVKCESVHTVILL